jgi:hypothetical protein
MSRNPDLDAAVAELDAVGIRDVTVAHGSKHLQLRWIHNGQLRVLAVSSTPSDRRSSHNKRAELRRQLRLDGLLPEPSAPPKPKRSSWREQVKSVSHQINRIPVPDEKVAELNNIVSALRQLADLERLDADHRTRHQRAEAVA